MDHSSSASETESEGSAMLETNETIRVLIADDHHLTRAGIRAVLDKEPGIKVVGEAQDATDVRELVTKLCPDVVLLDLDMPGLRPSQIDVWMRANCPEPATLILTTHNHDCYLAKTFEAGALGYLTKDQTAGQLVKAVRCAARGSLVLTRDQLSRINHWREEVSKRLERLTGRERSVLWLLLQGLGNAAIGRQLGLAAKTVEGHVTQILHKLDIASRQEAIVWVYRHLPVDLHGDSRQTQGNPCEKSRGFTDDRSTDLW
jgi:DNA-binding NarL/FixJ family response regulator